MNQATDLEKLISNEIIQDCFPKISDPTSLALSGTLTVEYPHPNTTVEQGNKLSPKVTQDAPKVTYKANTAAPLNLEKTYTLVMTDPDAPSRSDHKWSEYCHHVETGIKFNDPQGGLISNGHEVIKHMGPGPPKNTGDHRYIWMLFEEVEKNQTFSPINDRINWGYNTPATGIERWATENNLKLLAMNFFFAENDEN